MVQEIPRGGGYCATKVGDLCGNFFDIRPLVKTQVENGLDNLFDSRGKNIDVSDQSILY